MKFYINYIYKGNFEKGILPYESYIMIPTKENIMNVDMLDDAVNMICDYMEDLFNMESGEVTGDDVVIRNWKIIYG